MTDDVELHRLAVRRADMKLGFRAHLMAYAIVNAGLALINFVTTPGDWWVQWPMFGWGIGLLAHGVTVYFDGDNLRNRMIEEELERLRSKR